MDLFKLTARVTDELMNRFMGQAWIASKRYHVRPCYGAAVGAEV